ncbi:MAG: hypothetical protein GX589_04395 [Deltaproteobacteria bacterium]|nr:hypothetical protein [Deltaproteobacteria bacterium]
MSIDWLFELERAIENGKVLYACQGVGRNQWVIGKSVEELRKIAQRAANHKKLSIDIARIISAHEAVTGDMFLVPTDIGDPGHRGEPNIRWTAVETKEAAEMVKDVRKGPSPIFGIQIEETMVPETMP